LETLRGDRLRTYRAGLSEAQWLSSGIVVLTVLAEWAGLLPFVSWHSLFALCVIAASVGLSIRQRASKQRVWTHPAHLYEMARVFDTFAQGRELPPSPHKAVHLKQTSYGIQFSEEYSSLYDLDLHHATFSGVDGPLYPHEARQVAGMVLGWQPHRETATLIRDNNTIYHLIRYRNVKP
jgi:hypothetical protein